MEKKKLLCLALALLLICLNLAGCGAEYKGDNMTASPGSTQNNYQMGAGDSNGYFDMAEEPTAPDVPMEGGGSFGGDSAAPSRPHDKLIKRAELYLETTAFDSVAESLEGIVSNFGGYFETRNISNRST